MTSDNTFSVFIADADGFRLFARRFPSFLDASVFLVSLLEKRATVHEQNDDEGNAAAFRVAARAWAEQEDEEPGSGMLGDGRVYGIARDADDEREPTLREALADNGHGLDFLSFSRYVADDERADTSFRYGRDFSDERNRDDADFVGSRYLSGSDYSGGALVRANRKAIEAEIDDTDDNGDPLPLSLAVTAHGGYNTEATYFRLDVPHQSAAAVAEILLGLENYPVVSDEALSEQESEDEAESWASYGAWDFVRALESRHGLDDGFVSLSDDEAGNLFRIADNGSGLVEHEESVYFDVERAAERIPAGFLFYVGEIATSEGWRYGAEKGIEEPDEARRILRLVRIGDTLRALETALASRLARKADPEDGPRVEQGRDEARRLILDATIDEGDTTAPLDADAIGRVADRRFRVTFRRWRYGPEIDRHGYPAMREDTAVVDFDPFDTGASVLDAIEPILALVS